MIAALTARMIRYNADDPGQTNHALLVAAYSTLIAEREGCEPAVVKIVTAAGVLHDIGMHEAQRRHGSTVGRYQELEGPPIARVLLDGLGFSDPDTERICFLVAHHHTYRAIDGLDFQVLVEADFIVNAAEGAFSERAIASIRRKVFKTPTGIELLDTLFPAADRTDGS